MSGNDGSGVHVDPAHLVAGSSSGREFAVARTYPVVVEAQHESLV